MHRLRYWRNRLLRVHVLTTRDMARASMSNWTWGAESAVATEAFITPLSLLHDLADAFGYKLSLYLPDEAGTVNRDDPRWLTEATLQFGRN